MSTPVTFNNIVYPVPVQGDVRWGPALTRYLVALGTYALSPAGGSFPLTADVNFGTSFGLVGKYLSSTTASPATAGVLRLAKTDSIGWKNNGGSGNNLLAVNGSDLLTYNGVALQAAGNYISDLTGDVTATGPGSVPATLATVNVSPGTYVSANITVNAKGLVTAASSGAGGGTVTSVSGTANQIDSTGGAAPVLSLSSTLIFPGSATGTLTGHSTLDLALTGGTMSGAIAMGSNKVTGLAAATTNGDALRYEQLVGAYLLLTGGTMSGAIAMGANKITGLANGTAASDSASFGQIYYGFQAPVQATTTTQFTTTSGTFQTTNLTASITPTSISHRIKVTVTGAGSNSTSGTNGIFSIFRGSTNLAGANGFANIMPAAAALAKCPVAMSFIDSPATTSSTTYSVKIFNDGGATTSFPTSAGETCVMILEEII